MVVLDRYVPSNVAHQASKVEGAERAELQRRILDIEFGIFGMPRPDLVLLLDVPVAGSTTDRAKEQPATTRLRKPTSRKPTPATSNGCARCITNWRGRRPNWQTIACCDGDRLRSVDRNRRSDLAGRRREKSQGSRHCHESTVSFILRTIMSRE